VWDGILVILAEAHWQLLRESLTSCLPSSSCIHPWLGQTP
jgi:hypothetical protein